MNKIILLMLIIVGVASAVPIDTFVIVGGISLVDTSAKNGGMHLSTVGYTDMQTSTGGPVDTALNAAASNNGSGKVRITQTGRFDGAIPGIYAYCDFASVYTDGRYRVIDYDASNSYIDIELTYSSDATVTEVRVGGAIGSISTATKSTQCYANDRVIKISNIKVWNTPDSNCIINAKRFNPSKGSNDDAVTWQNTVKFLGVLSTTGELATDRSQWTEIYPNSGTVDAVYVEENQTFQGFYIHGCRYGFTGGYATSYNTYQDLKLESMTQGFYIDDACYFRNVEISNCQSACYGGNANAVVMFACYVHNCGNGTDNYILLNGSAYIEHCLFVNNVGDYQLVFNNGTINDCVFLQDSVDQIGLVRIADQYTGPFNILHSTFYGNKTGGFSITGIKGARTWDNAIGMNMAICGSIFDNLDTALVLTTDIKSGYYDGNNVTNCDADCSNKVVMTNTTRHLPNFVSVANHDLTPQNDTLLLYPKTHRVQKWVVE